MPKDADMGRALAASITANSSGRIKKAEFRYDPFLEFDKLPDSQVFISPQRVRDFRIARGLWQRDCTLDAMFLVKQSPNETSSEAFIDRWLDEVDKVIEFIKDTAILGHKATEIERDARYDRNLLNDGKRLLCLWSIAYKAI